MVIGLVVENGLGAIELLGNEQAHHLVIESHAAERNLPVGSLTL